jgi:hypothetical protein
VLACLLFNDMLLRHLTSLQVRHHNTLVTGASDGRASGSASQVIPVRVAESAAEAAGGRTAAATAQVGMAVLLYASSSIVVSDGAAGGAAGSTEQVGPWAR